MQLHEHLLVQNLVVHVQQEYFVGDDLHVLKSECLHPRPRKAFKNPAVTFAFALSYLLLHKVDDDLVFDKGVVLPVDLLDQLAVFGLLLGFLVEEVGH